MTGPEHYREAERLIAEMPRRDLPHEDIAMIQRDAQIHATLALAAATAVLPGIAGMAPLADYKAWAGVAAVETNDEEPQS